MNRIIVAASIAVVASLASPSRLVAASNSQSATEPSPPSAAESSRNALDRRSPRDTVEGFLAATDKGDYQQAAAYLEKSGEGPPADAARKLRAVLDRQVWIDHDALNDDAAGDRNDGLADDRESLGWLATPDGAREVLLQRMTRDGGQRWLFSGSTVAAAAKVYDQSGYGRLAALGLPAPLIEYQFLHVQLWQWVALLLLAPAAWLVAWVTTFIVARLLAPLARRTRTGIDDQMVKLARGPTRLLIGVGVFSAGRQVLDLTAVARAMLSAGEYLLTVAAVTWLVLRLIAVAGDALGEALQRRGQTEVVSLVPPGRRTVQVCVVALAIIALLDGFGFNVTTVLAGLGVGGIAVALAAQKSIENLFGGITLFADRPIRVGDVCRFGGTLGVVEGIGLRSTRVRTLERCVVTVPNAEFANLQLENLSQRDKFWYHPTLGLRYETTPDQLRYVLVEVRRMLYAHPKVDPRPARIRFTRFGACSLDLEIFAYVLADDYDQYLEVAEDLNLRLMDIVEDAGTSFAFPSSTMYVESGSGLDADRSKRAEQTVAQWREQDALYLPRFPDDKISELHGTLPYPPPGAPATDHNGRER